MTDRINRQSAAFREALDYCRTYGLNWKKHLLPKTEKRETTGYFVIDETFTTVVKTVPI